MTGRTHQMLNRSSHNTGPHTLDLHERVISPAGPQALSDERPSAVVQRQQIEAAQGAPNLTGLPDNLKSGIESLSGLALDDVHVHYNSPRPAGLQALAYTQGSEIYVAPGQGRHLPHEAWHVVQQKQGRVKPTLQMKDTRINDDDHLEHEADHMGAQAAAGPVGSNGSPTPVQPQQAPEPALAPVQREVDPAELAFMTTEELIKQLETLSLTEIYTISRSLAKMYKSSQDKPSHVTTVEKYLADQVVAVSNKIEQFTARAGYVASRTLDIHELFGNLTLTLYPLEGENPVKEKGAHRPHRPILDIEFVGREPYARCYLGLYAMAPDSQYKDITASETGEITLKDIGLMNLGNPFKALLWCEDYLTNQEHYKNSDKKPAPKPVVRSFLVPLSDALGLLLKEGEFSATRPLDQDRGSGQFGNRGDSNIYAKVLHPLIGSLVSFFHDQEEYGKTSEKGQKKYGLVNLQEYLTGQRGDPRSITKSGIAAQHGRGNYEAEFEEEYVDVMKAYYDSVDTEVTEFTGATSESLPEYRKSRDIPKVFDGFPQVKKQIGLLSGTGLGSKGTTRSKDEEPSKPPPGLVRLRAFINAYSQLPIQNNGAPGNVVVEGEKKSEKDDEKPASTESPKKSESVVTPGTESLKKSESVVTPSTESPKKSESEKAPSVESSGSKKPEKENPKNQYVQQPGGPAIPAAWFQLLRNPGGGDCLFHALSGRTLNNLEMLVLRGRVANVRKRMPDTVPGSAYNANVAAATITQTPSLMHFAPLVQGRGSVPNRVLALMQATPGVYAGPEELIQWCRLFRRTVYVIDQDGSFMEYNAAGGRQLFVYIPGLPAGRRAQMLNRMRRVIDRRLLVLYKSPGHWELIQGLRDTFAVNAPVPGKKGKPDVIDWGLARQDYENAKGIRPEEYGNMSFSDFMKQYKQDI